MKNKQSNPFVIGRYIDSYYFCDREAETSFLKKMIENGWDIAIISPRRLGKTGLINNKINLPHNLHRHICHFFD